MGSAKDIVEYCGVARLLFTDFPLGNPCGEPFNVKQQKEIFLLALDLLESAKAPRTTVQTPFIWPHGDKWKEIFLSKNQPRDKELEEKMERAKEKYRELRKEGKV